MGVRPSAFCANAYDDYAYSLKGAIRFGTFSSTGNQRRISGFPRRTWHAGRTGVSGWIPRGISGGHTGRSTGRRSSADDSSTAIHTANVGHHICHRSRRDQRLPIPQHVHLVEQRRAILVLPGIPRTYFCRRVQMVRIILGVLWHRFEPDSLIHVLLSKRTAFGLFSLLCDFIKKRWDVSRTIYP